MNVKKVFLSLLLAAMLCAPFTASAQVTIGSVKPPSEFSILELISNDARGLRLPQLTTAERNVMMETSEFQKEKEGKAMGLMIFNTNIRCVETWDGGRWVRSSHCPCGAYVAPGDWRRFMCHNLGADTSLDPFTPHPGLHGAMFKWGTGIYALSGAQNNAQSPNLVGTPDWAGRGGTPPANAADWNMATANPCPPGFRVPTADEWRGVISNNTIRRVGTSWTANNNPYPTGNFSSGVLVGDALFLPTAGQRINSGVPEGRQDQRGSTALYWSSTANSTNPNNAFNLWISISGIGVSQGVTGNANRANGFPVRCIAE